MTWAMAEEGAAADGAGGAFRHTISGARGPMPGAWRLKLDPRWSETSFSLGLNCFQTLGSSLGLPQGPIL